MNQELGDPPDCGTILSIHKGLPVLVENVIPFPRDPPGGEKAINKITEDNIGLLILDTRAPRRGMIVPGAMLVMSQAPMDRELGDSPNGGTTLSIYKGLPFPVDHHSLRLEQRIQGRLGGRL